MTDNFSQQEIEEMAPPDPQADPPIPQVACPTCDDTGEVFTGRVEFFTGAQIMAPCPDCGWW